MATASISYVFTNGTNADGVQVNSNFSSILTFLNTEVIQRDASIAFTNIPILPGSDPSTDNQAARKAYVDKVVPAGIVVQFAGTVAPSGWVLCDGTAYSRTNATYSRLFTAISTTYGPGDGITTFNVPDFRGRFPVALSAADAEFNALGETGGTKTETLTVNQMPSHTHVQDSHNHTQNSHNHIQDAHNHTQNPHTHTQEAHTHTLSPLTETSSGFTNGATNIRPFGSGSNSSDQATSIPSSSATPTINNATATNNSTTGTNQAETATNNATTAVNQTTGGGASHNNLPPYMAMNFIIKL
jgi:microcystin-dependent protein